MELSLQTPLYDQYALTSVKTMMHFYRPSQLVRLYGFPQACDCLPL
jgi:hypothetical protein